MCVYGPLQWGCDGIKSITCIHGQGGKCDDTDIVRLDILQGRDGAQTRLAVTTLPLSNKSHPGALAECVDFRKKSIPCDELEKARAFNRRLNEGTVATKSRSYDWVRASMTRDGLPGERWHVGHMCPKGGKPKTWPGNKARNLIAQTATDNAGPGGLQSKQMTAAEAAFYSRTLTTCAELPPLKD